MNGNRVILLLLAITYELVWHLALAEGSAFKFAGNFDEYEATRTAKKSRRGRYLLTNIEIDRDSYVVQYEGTAIPSGTFKIGFVKLKSCSESCGLHIANHVRRLKVSEDNDEIVIYGLREFTFKGNGRDRSWLNDSFFVPKGSVAYLEQYKDAFLTLFSHSTSNYSDFWINDKTHELEAERTVKNNKLWRILMRVFLRPVEADDPIYSLLGSPKPPPTTTKPTTTTTTTTTTPPTTTTVAETEPFSYWEPTEPVWTTTIPTTTTTKPPTTTTTTTTTTTRRTTVSTTRPTTTTRTTRTTRTTTTTTTTTPKPTTRPRTTTTRRTTTTTTRATTEAWTTSTPRRSEAVEERLSRPSSSSTGQEPLKPKNTLYINVIPTHEFESRKTTRDGRLLESERFYQSTSTSSAWTTTTTTTTTPTTTKTTTRTTRTTTTTPTTTTTTPIPTTTWTTWTSELPVRSTSPAKSPGSESPTLNLKKYKRSEIGKYISVNNYVKEDSVATGFDVYMVSAGLIKIGFIKFKLCDLFDQDSERCLAFVSNQTKLEKKNCEYFGGRDGSGELFNLNNGFNRVTLNQTYFVPKHSLVYIEQYYDGLAVLIGQHKRTLRRSDIYVVYDYSGLNMTRLKTANNFNWKINIEPRVVPLIEYLSRKSTLPTRSYELTTTTTTRSSTAAAPYRPGGTTLRITWPTRWVFTTSSTSKTTTTTPTRTTRTTTTMRSSEHLQIYPRYKRTKPGKYLLLNSELLEDSLVSGFEVYMIEPGMIEIGFIRFSQCNESTAPVCGRLISALDTLPSDHVFIGGDRFYANAYGYNYLQLTRAYQVPRGALVYLFQENHRNRGGLLAYISANVLTYSDVRLAEHAGNRISMVSLENDSGLESDEDWRRMKSKLCLKIHAIRFEHYSPSIVSDVSGSLTATNVDKLSPDSQYLQLRSTSNDNYYILLNNRANSESAFLNSFEVLLSQPGTIKIGYMRLKECDAYSIASRKYFTPVRSDPRHSTHYLDMPGLVNNDHNNGGGHFYSQDSSNEEPAAGEDCLATMMSEGSIRSTRFTPVYLTENEYRLTSGYNKIRLQRPNHLPRNSYIYLKQIYTGRAGQIVALKSN